MGTKCWRWVVSWLAVFTAIVLLGSFAGPALAQMLPFERNKVEAIDPRQAFLDGYNSYQRRDWPAAIERMQLAAAQVPDLIDYALYYQALAQRESGDSSGAAATLRRLTASYPQSVLADQATLDYADIELKLARPDLALVAGRTVADRTADAVLEQSARLMVARALSASGDYSGAYAKAQALRERFPTGATDGAARDLVYQILAAHPAVANTGTLTYRRDEAALLVREGRPSAALEQIAAALAMEPPQALRIELAWLQAQASHGDPERQRAALNRYLGLAPNGVHAAAALNALAHSWWHTDNTDVARQYFGRLVRDLAGSSLAPEALFEMGRTYEDDSNREAARTQYLRLIARYPESEAAADARFRAPFMLFMLRRYDQASAEFAESASRADQAKQNDMFSYWQARSLEVNGESVQARLIYQRVALSLESNYYPALAELKVHTTPPSFPAALAAEPVAAGVPSATGLAQFHLLRAVALRDLTLRDLEAAELRAVEANAAANPALRDFVLAEYSAAGAYHDSIMAATRLAARGELNPQVAERMRYPRGYWNLVSEAAARNALDPYLLLALIRQESLFDPKARSNSDARGLMQLLPTTAQRWAPDAGLPSAPLDLYEPELSVRVGTVYLRNLMTMFDGDRFKAVAAYNGGEHAVAGWAAKYPGDDDQWVENIGFHETRDYVKKVIGGLREYRLIYAAAAVPISAPPLQTTP
ncbi:MAG TPA: transglycosylase SLT domain-containing protein [Candidatus Binataceae bacterium]|nr:transglycosylase SLT domain-containing protein [Candidatus Binataceae bacterium]